MNTDGLHDDAYTFRQALEACHRDLDSTIFGRFPRGCCGAVSELLAVFLESRGHGQFVYICGVRFDDDGCSSSHAWLERNGLIVDITRDQFADDGGPVLVTTDRSWHDCEFPQQEKLGAFPGLTPELRQAYGLIMPES